MVRCCVSLVYAWRRHEAAPHDQAVQMAMINTLFSLGEMLSQVMERNPAVFARAGWRRRRRRLRSCWFASKKSRAED